MQFDDMTEQERLVWAATYGAAFMKLRNDRIRGDGSWKRLTSDQSIDAEDAANMANWAVAGLREMKAEDDA